jgi:hypothetical protein
VFIAFVGFVEFVEFLKTVSCGSWVDYRLEVNAQPFIKIGIEIAIGIVLFGICISSWFFVLFVVAIFLFFFSSCPSW